MKKQILEKFINKYYLSGAVDSVKLQANPGKLAVHFCGVGNGMVGFVETNEITLDDGEYNIFETTQLKTLLAVLGDDITISVQNTNGTPTAFKMSDGASKVNFALSDPKSILPVPVPKNVPTMWDVVFTVNQKFRDAFIKAKSALSDVERFAVLATDQSAEVVIGYEPEINTHSVSITPEVTHCQTMKATYFVAAFLKDILAANKEMPDTVIKASAKGILNIAFQSPELRAEYYLFQKLK